MGSGSQKRQEAQVSEPQANIGNALPPTTCSSLFTPRFRNVSFANTSFFDCFFMDVSPVVPKGTVPGPSILAHPESVAARILSSAGLATESERPCSAVAPTDGNTRGGCSMLEDWTNRESNGVGLLLNALAGATALRFRLSVTAAGLALIGIALILDGRHRRRQARLAAVPLPAPPEVRYTSNGLDTRTLGTSPTSGSGNVTTILQVRPSGTELPQPLELRVECSHELHDGYATFYLDSIKLEAIGGRVHTGPK